MMSAATPTTPRHPRRRPLPQITPRGVLAVVLAGIAAGIIGLAMVQLLDVFEHLFYGVDTGTLDQRVAAAPTWRKVLAPAVGGVLAGISWWRLRATGGVISVEGAVLDPSGQAAKRMGWWRPLIDSVTQVLVVGAGNSIGREGAPRLTAGAVSAYIGRWLKLEQHSVAYLIAAGAGAGLASVYNTPLGGAAYAVEIVLIAGMRRRGLLFALPVSVIATVVAWLGNHNAPTYTTPDITLSWGDLLGALLLIPITLGLGLVSRTLWMWAKDRRVEQGLLLPLTIGLAGACTGVASIWLPMVPGNGKDAMQVALTSPGTQAALLMLLAVVVLKPLLTGATLGAGATGGLLTPSLAAGASAGAALAYGLQYAGLDANIALLAFIGAGAVLAVTQKAPWFGVLFTWELIQGPWWSLLLIAAVVACVWQLATRLNQSHTRRRKITESQP